MNGVSWALALLAEMLLQDRDLHFELVDPVFEEENLLGFDIDVPGGQPLEASPANPSREAGCEQHGSDEQGNGGIDEVEVLCRGASSKAPSNGASEANPGDSIARNGGRESAGKARHASACYEKG